jgi:cleavage and polyadenylation specificity factor subunit 1
MYIRGADNIVADCLSRPTNAVQVDICDLPAIASEQEKDEEIEKYKDKLRNYPMQDNVSLWCENSLSYPRPYVPLQSRHSIFNSLHDISHPGVKSSLKLIKSRYYWPDMDRNIREWCRECTSCQQAKINRHTKSPVHQFYIPSERFQTVHVDIVGPLPPTKQHGETYFSPFRYILTCIDRTTRWVEAAPLTDITAASVAAAFLNVWISRFGVPLHVITDRGSQFEAELFSELSKLVGFHRLRTTSYHPQTNGKLERIHRTIKTSIKARKQSWLDALPIVLLGLRCIPNETTYSPFMAVTGSSMLVPQPILANEEPAEYNHDQIKILAQEMSQLDLSQFSTPHHDTQRKTYVPSDLDKCSHVWVRVDRVRRPLEAPYSGPYVVKRRHPKYFIIELSTGKEQSVSVDRLKPAVISPKTVPTTPQPSVPENNSQLVPENNAKLVPENNAQPVLENNAQPVPENNAQPEPENSSLATLKPVPTTQTSRSGRRIKFNTKNDYFYYQ